MKLYLCEGKLNLLGVNWFNMIEIDWSAIQQLFYESAG